MSFPSNTFSNLTFSTFLIMCFLTNTAIDVMKYIFSMKHCVKASKNREDLASAFTLRTKMVSKRPYSRTSIEAFSSILLIGLLTNFFHSRYPTGNAPSMPFFDFNDKASCSDFSSGLDVDFYELFYFCMTSSLSYFVHAAVRRDFLTRSQG